MANSDDLAMVRRLREEKAELESELERLKGGRGGGTSDDMERRVQKLEGDVSDIRSVIGDIRTSLATIEERTKHFPTRWDVFLILAAVLGLIGATIAIVRALYAA